MKWTILSIKWKKSGPNKKELSSHSTAAAAQQAGRAQARSQKNPRKIHSGDSVNKLLSNITHDRTNSINSYWYRFPPQSDRCRLDLSSIFRAD